MPRITGWILPPLVNRAWGRPAPAGLATNVDRQRQKAADHCSKEWTQSAPIRIGWKAFATAYLRSSDPSHAQPQLSYDNEIQHRCVPTKFHPRWRSIGGLMHHSRRSRAADRYLRVSALPITFWITVVTAPLRMNAHMDIRDAVWCRSAPRSRRAASLRCHRCPVADRRHWPPEQIVPLCGKHRLYGICFGNANQCHKSRGIDD